MSPLRSAAVDAATVERLRALCSEIVEEPTTRGFRVKFILSEETTPAGTRASVG